MDDGDFVVKDEQNKQIKKIEELLAHQEVLVQDLSNEIKKQWKFMEGIDKRMEELEEIFEEINLSSFSAKLDDPPPHY